MTMNEKDEQAFKVACDALYAWGYSEQFSRSLWITALEYARNKQAEPVAQPYAYVYEFDSGMFGIHRSFSSNERNGSKPSRVVPVYTHPAQPVRLTEEEIEQEYSKADAYLMMTDHYEFGLVANAIMDAMIKKNGG